ncbi:unnamed protein product [Calypogeia fissa]
MSIERKLKLVSSDKQTFEVDESLVRNSKMVMLAVEHGGIEIAFPTTSGATLAKVIDYWKYHLESQQLCGGQPAVSEDATKQWNADFLEVEHEMLCQLVTAAYDLKDKSLLGLTCQAVADKILACKTPEEIRKAFNIVNDFTPEEEEENRKLACWCVPPGEEYQTLPNTEYKSGRDISQALPNTDYKSGNDIPDALPNTDYKCGNDISKALIELHVN